MLHSQSVHGGLGFDIPVSRVSPNVDSIVAYLIIHADTVQASRGKTQSFPHVNAGIYTVHCHNLRFPPVGAGPRACPEHGAATGGRPYKMM